MHTTCMQVFLSRFRPTLLVLVVLRSPRALGRSAWQILATAGQLKLQGFNLLGSQ